MSVSACLVGDPDYDYDYDYAKSTDLAVYYQSVDESTAANLRATLHAVIDDHKRFPYTSSKTDVWNILELADEDPADPNRVLDIYKNDSYPKQGGGNSFYNREHLWPKSIGFPRDGSKNYPYTDAHHLFISNSTYNSTRSNKHFDTCAPTCTEVITEFNHGEGGGSGTYPGNSNWTTGGGTSGTWEAWSERRGEVARAMFYMDVRYEGGTHNITGTAEPDLRLTDQIDLIVSDSSTNRSVAHMGRLATLLAWHEEDPVSDRERIRNDVVASFQGNRNPFIDHPEWVDCLYRDRCGDADPGDPADAAWINEIHYNNSGSDVDEGVEVAAVAGSDLGGWSLVLYNGSNGSSYQRLALNGIVNAQQGGAGTRWFAISGVQNGAPDGIALVAPNGQVHQFLSYQGTMTASDGEAAGMTSQDIGVAESGSTPLGHSLQLTGTGCSAGDFAWAQPSAATRDQVNSAQTLACP